MIVSGSVGNQPQTGTVTITVAPRDWTNRVVFPPEPAPEWDGGDVLKYPPIVEGDTLADGTLGQSVWPKPEPAAGYAEGTGPNAGWYFFGEPPYFSSRESHIYLNIALRPTDPFWRAQRGSSDGQIVMGTPACGANFMRLAARHVPINEHGHYALAQALAKGPQGTALLEGAVHWGDPFDAPDEMISEYLRADSTQQAKWDRDSVLHVRCELTRPQN